jgi:hypothetical protein
MTYNNSDFGLTFRLERVQNLTPPSQIAEYIEQFERPNTVYPRQGEYYSTRKVNNSVFQ